MELPVELYSKIVEFLTSLPNIHDSSAQQAFIFSAGLDSRLQERINYSGSPAQFFQLLVSTLIGYGKLEDGRDALEAVLDAAKNSVGKDRQEYCDSLIQELHTFKSAEEFPRQKLSDKPNAQHSKGASQTITATDHSAVSNITQVHINGNVIDSKIAIAGRDVVKGDGKELKKPTK